MSKATFEQEIDIYTEEEWNALPEDKEVESEEKEEE